MQSNAFSLTTSIISEAYSRSFRNMLGLQTQFICNGMQVLRRLRSCLHFDYASLGFTARSSGTVGVSHGKRSICKSIILAKAHKTSSRTIASKGFGNSTNGMRLLQFEYQGAQKIGIELSDGGDVVNLTDADKKFPSSMVSFLNDGDIALSEAKKYINDKTYILPRSAIKLLSPITQPDKVICIGMNYRDHCLEQNAPIPEEPIIFSKFPSTIIAPGEPIVIPKISDAVDWEVELAVVIGKKGKNIEASQAMDYVVGFTVAHDVSARDWQMHKNGKQWLLGKTFDTFCPLGPAIVTKDSISDPHKLGLRCLVNNFPMQDSGTDQLIFGTEECVAWVSQFCTLEPGDLILTGTPPGVGVFRKPPVYLKPGDVVTCEIDEIGKITNPVVAEE